MRIERYRGDTYPLEIEFINNDTVVDITGASTKLNIVGNSKTLAIVGSTIDAANGLAQFTFLTTDVDTAGTYNYDIELTDVSGYITTFAKGEFKLLEDVG